MAKKQDKKKLKAIDKRSAQVKCEEMFNTLQINKDIGNSAITALSREMKRSLKPMNALADKAVEYFKDKMDDEHTHILFAVFSLLFSRILFDPTIGTVTMSKIKKGEEDNGQEEASKSSGRIIIP